MDFVKMQGCGNDYIFVDVTRVPLPPSPSRFARLISDRHFGVGSDGLIVILKSSLADLKLLIFNADGSEGKMCGNALRCAARYAFDYMNLRYRYIYIETVSGIHQVILSFDSLENIHKITVDMGSPSFRASDVPVQHPSLEVIDKKFCIGEYSFKGYCLSMGNPHLVSFDFDITTIASSINSSELFPEGINLSYAKVIDSNNISAIVYERGAGPTLSCGTAACACAMCSILGGYTQKEVFVHMPGGILTVTYNKNLNKLYLSGNADYICRGKYPFC